MLRDTLTRPTPKIHVAESHLQQQRGRYPDIPAQDFVAWQDVDDEELNEEELPEDQVMFCRLAKILVKVLDNPRTAAKGFSRQTDEVQSALLTILNGLRAVQSSFPSLDECVYMYLVEGMRGGFVHIRSIRTVLEWLAQRDFSRVQNWDCDATSKLMHEVEVPDFQQNPLEPGSYGGVRMDIVVHMHMEIRVKLLNRKLVDGIHRYRPSWSPSNFVRRLADATSKQPSYKRAPCVLGAVDYDTEYPLAKVVDMACPWLMMKYLDAEFVSDNQCLHCGSAGALSKCAGCRRVRYCNRDCQKADWKRHKTTCKKVRDICRTSAVLACPAAIQEFCL